MKKNICIIGSGISGMVCARYCKKYNLNYIILEKNNSFGGCWLSKSYPGVRIQTPKTSYCFSDHPFPKNTSMYPTRDELLNYFESYCIKHNIFSNCLFNTEVISSLYNKVTKEWKLIIKKNNEKHIIICDYLLIASGFYTDAKNIDYNKNTSYNENIIHATDLSYLGKFNYEKFKNKNIIIIGNGPTGCDLATELYKTCRSVRILYRSDKWLLRRYLWEKIDTAQFLNRFNMLGALIIPYYASLLFLLIFYYIVYLLLHRHLVFSPFKLMDVPYPPFKLISRDNLTINENIVELIYNNQIDYRKINGITIHNNYILDKKCRYNFDYCIFANGYKNDLKFLKLNSIPYLYKHIIHPNLENCGFVGFATSFNWIQVSELQAIWYINYILGNIKKETKYEMGVYIDKLENLKKKNKYDYHDLALYSFSYCDELSKDCNIKLKYDINDMRYWFRPPEGDLWLHNNKI